MKLLIMGESSFQSVWAYLRRGGAGSKDGVTSNIVMGTWPEPVEGRAASQYLTKCRRRRLARARSITEGGAFRERGNLEYTPGELSRAKPPGAANSRSRVEEEPSGDKKERTWSAKGLWMFRSRTTKSGMPVLGKRNTGGRSGLYGLPS